MSRPVPPPPARPSTAWRAGPPSRARRSGKPPSTLIISFWLWLAAVVVAVLTTGAALTEFERMHAVLVQMARAQDAAADTATIEQVANATIAIVVGSGLLVALLQLGLAPVLRAGRNWARIVLTVLAALGIGYGFLVVATVDDRWLGDLVVVVRAGVLLHVVLVLAAVVMMFRAAASNWIRH